MLPTADWNKNFQRLLSMADSLTKFGLLGELARDFNYAASLYGALALLLVVSSSLGTEMEAPIHIPTGMIIINEVNLPPQEKTIKPVGVGGVAGGIKFIANGILFKVSQP